MDPAIDLEALTPDHVFDGGDLDCGSGLVLLLRENMLKVPIGGVLEMRSREPTVADELPSWCRMVGHDLLGLTVGVGYQRYFIRRGGPDPDAQAKALGEDQHRAAGFEWRVRARSTGPRQSTVYCRNFSFAVGQPASFEEKDAHPSAVELLLGSLAGALTTAFASECSRAGLAVDDIEITARGRLGNPLAALGLHEGDPAFTGIEVRCYASTFEDEPAVRAAWDRCVRTSPIAATLTRCVALETSLAIV